jgi:hypothetical protein
MDTVGWVLILYGSFFIYHQHAREKVEDFQFREIVRLLQKLAGIDDDTWDEKWFEDKRFWR